MLARRYLLPSSCNDQCWRYTTIGAWKEENAHNEREQTVIATNDQEQSKIGSAYALLNRGCEDEVSSEGDSARPHDVPASVPSTITVQSLEDHHKPPDEIWSHSHPLSVDRGEPKSFDQLEVELAT